MISKIQNTDNNISMQARCRLFSRKYSTHTPKMRSYREFEFMPELQKKNQIKQIYINLVNKICSIF